MAAINKKNKKIWVIVVGLEAMWRESYKFNEIYNIIEKQIALRQERGDFGVDWLGSEIRFYNSINKVRAFDTVDGS